MRSIGIDPGSNSFDIFGLENDSIIIDEVIPTKQIIQNPDLLIERIKSFEPFDTMIAPSGFGIPLKKVSEISDDDIFKMTLKKESKEPVVGLHAILEKLKHSNWNAYYLPGIKLLPTIPDYRKLNRIDMGTADKLCSVVYCMNYLKNSGKSVEEMDFIMVELGYAFSAVISIVNGKIVDGIGGTQLMGFGSMGALDGELAYLIQPIRKKDIYKSSINRQIKALYPEESEFNENMLENPDINNRFEMIIECTIKNIYALLKTSGFTNHQKIDVLFTGRYSKNSFIMNKIKMALAEECKIKIPQLYISKAGTAAKGAALIAEGLNGGRNKEIIERLGIDSATDDIFNHIDLNINLKER